MTIEFTSNVHSVKIIQGLCDNLVENKMATVIKDSYKSEDDLLNGQKKFETQVDVRVYRNYVINIKTAPVYLPWDADIRFWYDKRNNRAGIKLSAESLMAIIQSVTVIKYLKKLDVKLTGDDNKLTLDTVAQAITEVFGKTTGEKPYIEARKLNNRRS